MVDTVAEPLWLRASRALEGRVQPMELPRFWEQLRALGWSTRSRDSEGCAERLAELLTPAEVVSMRLRLEQLDGQLAKTVEIWEMQREESIGLPPGLQQALREHVIALGEASFQEALHGPWRVKHRAERDDYLEGLAKSFELAMRRYPPEVLEAALAG